MRTKKTSILNAAINGLMAGAGMYAGQLATTFIPLSGAAPGGIVFAGGVMLSKVGAPAAFANGMAGSGALSAVSAMMPLPGLNGAPGLGKIGRRKLSRAEVAMIEAAAATDRVSGVRAETLHGTTAFVNRKTNLF